LLLGARPWRTASATAQGRLCAQAARVRFGEPLPAATQTVTRPSWTVSGPAAVMAKVEAQPSARQWARRLRGEVCACPDAACAQKAQRRYADAEGLAAAPDDADEVAQLMQEAAACTVRLLDAETAAR
jgi:hypothetical protein